MVGWRVWLVLVWFLLAGNIISVIEGKKMRTEKLFRILKKKYFAIIREHVKKASSTRRGGGIEGSIPYPLKKKESKF